MKNYTVKTDGLMEKEASARRARILNLPDTVPEAGTKWYISPNGDDSHAGNSAEQAWCSTKSLEIHAGQINPGDAVLFERGGVYRGNIVAASGVFYGAYGTGAKPCIKVSKMNYAKADWKNQGGGIWMLEDGGLSDVGIIVFNHGDAVGVKKLSQEQVCEPFDFCGVTDNRLYLYLQQAPSDFESIEIGDLTHIIYIPKDTKNVTVENLTLKYSGGIGIRTSGGEMENITIRGCEIGWIGGSLLPNYKDGTVRFGNGIEFWNACKNIIVEDCWVYQIYDSGLSHQGNGEYVAENIIFKDNLVEYCCFGSIEYWLNDSRKNRMSNVLYSGNHLRFAGYGWGVQRPNKNTPVHLTGAGGSDNLAENFTVTGNIFEESTHMLMRVCSGAGTYPVINGNTYIQNKGGELGYMTSKKSLPFDDGAAARVRDEFKDHAAVVRYV